jgi:hypothetical protein
MDKKTHALLGGSTAHRWSQCTSSVALIKSLPPQAPSAAASEGTRVHGLVEKGLSSFLEYKVTGDDTAPWALDCGDDETAFTVTEYISTVWKEVLEQSITDKAYALEDTLVLDKSLDMWGSADFWAVYVNDKAQRAGWIVDFKNGFVEVPIEKNAQCAFYACALRKEIQSKGKNLDVVFAGIFQPASTKPWKVTKFTSKQLDTWEKRFYKAAETIFVTKKTKFKVGSHCKFCPAQAVCTAYVKETSTRTSLQLLNVNEVTLPTPELLPDDTLRNIVFYGDMIEDFIKSVKAYAVTRFQARKPIQGVKIVETATRRAWEKDEEMIAARLIDLGVTDPWAKKLIGITVAEKKLKGKLPEDLCTRTTPSLTPVSADDPRPEAVPSVDLLPVEES